MALTRATGKPLGELLQTRVTSPLELRRTTLAPYDIAAPEMRGYTIDRANGSMKDLTDDSLPFGNGGSGGVISTGGELLTIIQAIVSGRLVEPSLLSDMKRATPESKESYGLGLATYHLTCGSFYGHGGSIDGTQSIAIVSLDGSEGVVIAINLRTETDPNLLGLAESLLCPT
jgi:D-alanyl-D-alanine carboxypeptidase